MFWPKAFDLPVASLDDPLARVTQPRSDETADQRRRRLLDQEEAQHVSRKIDESLQEAKETLERRKRAVKVLLLGQAESGKSTTLKNFQLVSAPDHFSGEHDAWKTVIQLNLICSVKRLLDVLQEEWDAEIPAYSPPLRRDGSGSSRIGSGYSTPLTDEHRRIRMRLSPLLVIETSLNRTLLPDNYSLPTNEACVRAGSGWKNLLRSASTSKPDGRPGSGDQSRPHTAESRSYDDPTAILAAFRNDIIALWEDPVVRRVLDKHNFRPEEQPGFFLPDTERITALDYTPTDSDIVRARLRTFGVEEHRFVMDGTEWYIFDVGGSRSMRPHWVPYFDDVQAIIFLAPLAFNQVLEEDPKVNRLADSLHLWREVCENKLLASATIILFLNKMDILRANLAAGIKVVKYVPSYGNAPNDVQHVTRYFREKFRSLHKHLSPQQRPFRCYETSAIDTGATTLILNGVRDGILRAHYESGYLI